MAHIAYESLKRCEEVFRAFADQTRLRIVRLLFVGGESTVCELVDALGIPQYSVSRHLSILRHAKIVGERREGAWRYYSIPAKPDSFTGKLLALIESSLSEELLDKDLVLYKKRLALRVDGKCVVGTDG
ncbi:MAG: ArsR/SmtB family transcription factor [Eubacteriales bacterium]